MRVLAGGITTTPPAPTGPGTRHRITPFPTPAMVPAAALQLLDRTPARGRAREITIRVRRLDGDHQGKLRLSPVDAPWFAVVAGTPHDLARGLLGCFGEVEMRAYALLKRERPDGARFGDVDDDTTTPASASSAGRRGWRQQEWRTGGTEREQHPSNWDPNPDGTYTSRSSGRTARHPRLVAAITRRRVAAGLPTVPVDGWFDLSTLAETIGKAAADAGVTPHEWLTQAVDAALPARDGVAS